MKMIVIPYDELIHNVWFINWMEDQLGSRLYEVFFDAAMKLRWKTDEQGQVIKDSYYHISEAQVDRRLKRLRPFLPKTWNVICVEGPGVVIGIKEPHWLWILKQKHSVKELIDNTWEIEKSNQEEELHGKS